MRWAYTAAALAFASAAISACWTLGGTALLDTVGGEPEDLARERSAATVAIAVAIVAVGALLLAGAIDPKGDVDEHALRWHVFVWDLWFLVWGVTLALAARRAPVR